MASFAVAMPGGRQVTHTLPPPCRSKAEVAAWLGPYKLRRAIFFGTVINIVAFLPLALLPGDMGAFII